MDKVIHRHLDKRMDIQEKVADKAEAAVDDLDLDALLSNPERELSRVAKVAMVLVHGNAQEAATEGQRFAREVKKKDDEDKEILFQKTRDPKANEGEL